MDEIEPSVAELYDACYGRLVAQLLSVTADLAAAQDAVQEAFVKALSSPHSFATTDNPEAWLRTVALNSARSRWRRLRHADRLLGIGRAAPPAALQQVPAPGPDHVAVVAALRALPREQREAIALHHVADLPVAEVAAMLDVPVGTVKARLSRGRARLAVLLEDDDETTEVSRGWDRPAADHHPGRRPDGHRAPAAPAGAGCPCTPAPASCLVRRGSCGVRGCCRGRGIPPEPRYERQPPTGDTGGEHHRDSPRCSHPCSAGTAGAQAGTAGDTRSADPGRRH